MSYLYYVLPATVTFVIVLSAFFRDKAASKTSVLNWAFVLVAGALWPITLPFIVWKKLVSLFTQDNVEVIFRRNPIVESHSHIV
ncbi:MAG: hypothetical protein F6K11_27280 [Leptolyngbya sp. SIO3F4]|nr:hypothetical protein [Leptolyngbya sp. SIO3F4]